MGVTQRLEAEAAARQESIEHILPVVDGAHAAAKSMCNDLIQLERQERLQVQQDLWKALESHTHDLSVAKESLLEEKPMPAPAPAPILAHTYSGSLSVPIGPLSVTPGSLSVPVGSARRESPTNLVPV